MEFKNLNVDVLYEICKYLNNEDLLNLGNSCLFFKNFFDNEYWKHQCVLQVENEYRLSEYLKKNKNFKIIHVRNIDTFGNFINNLLTKICCCCNCENTTLEKLIVENVCNLYDDDNVMLKNLKFTKLRHLEILNVSSRDDAAFYKIEKFLKINCENLTNLKIKFKSKPVYKDKMKSKTFDFDFENFKNLKHLSIKNHFVNFTDSLLLCNLETLKISIFEEDGGLILTKIKNYCKNLKKIHLHYCESSYYYNNNNNNNNHTNEFINNIKTLNFLLFFQEFFQNNEKTICSFIFNNFPLQYFVAFSIFLLQQPLENVSIKFYLNSDSLSFQNYLYNSLSAELKQIFETLTIKLKITNAFCFDFSNFQNLQKLTLMMENYYLNDDCYYKITVEKINKIKKKLKILSIKNAKFVDWNKFALNFDRNNDVKILKIDNLIYKFNIISNLFGNLKHLQIKNSDNVDLQKLENVYKKNDEKFYKIHYKFRDKFLNYSNMYATFSFNNNV